jgi:radical SAM protein with 4Fe4S-binding SPASM domain
MIPPITVVESTNDCNLKCIVCARNYMTRKVGYIDLKLAEKIMAQIPVGRFFWAHGWGEPLLHPQFCEFVRIAKKRRLLIGAITNATLLDKEYGKGIIDSGLDWLVFSVDTDDEGVYEKIRVGANYHQVIENINNFLGLKRKLASRKPYTQINILDLPLTTNRISSLVNMWRGRVDRIRVKKTNEYGELCPQIHALTNRQLLPRSTVCSALRKGGIIIYWDGRVGPCCTDFDGRIIYGDLNEQSLSSVWNSQTRLELKNKQERGEFPDMCKFCHTDEQPFTDV